MCGGSKSNRGCSADSRTFPVDRIQGTCHFAGCETQTRSGESTRGKRTRDTRPCISGESAKIGPNQPPLFLYIYVCMYTYIYLFRVGQSRQLPAMKKKNQHKSAATGSDSNSEKRDSWRKTWKRDRQEEGVEEGKRYITERTDGEQARCATAPSSRRLKL